MRKFIAILAGLFAIPSDACDACAMGRCGQGPKDNRCSCCRSNHM